MTDEQGYRWVGGWEDENLRIDSEYYVLLRPNGSEVTMLTEPEDRVPYRDLAPVTKELDALRTIAAQLAEALRITGPSWLEAVPEGLSPEFYHTLSFAGDKEIHDKVSAALEAWEAYCRA